MEFVFLVVAFVSSLVELLYLARLPHASPRPYDMGWPRDFHDKDGVKGVKGVLMVAEHRDFPSVGHASLYLDVTLSGGLTMARSDWSTREDRHGLGRCSKASGVAGWGTDAVEIYGGVCVCVCERERERGEG